MWRKLGLLSHLSLYLLPFTISFSHADCLQPVYIIAHRCNTDGDVSDVVSNQGINAIEADFSYGKPLVGADPRWVVDHDGVFTFSTDLNDWLDDVAATSSTLSLVIFDIKDPDGPLDQLYDKARAKLGADINLLFSIGDYESRNQFDQIKSRLENDPRAGAAIDFLVDDETQAKVQSFFISKGITKYWYGDGFNAATVTPASVIRNVDDGIALRDGEGDCGGFHGVYTWTYEKESSIKGFLDKGVNGIFLNAAECFGRLDPAGAWDPKDAAAYAKTLPGKKFATRSDNPFEFTLPSISCPANRTVECTSTGGTSRDNSQLTTFLNGATSSSNSCDAVTLTNTAPLSFPVNQTTSVVFTAIDDSNCNPSASCAASVSVRDTTAPTIALNTGPSVLECSVDSYVEPGASASDICDAVVPVTIAGSVDVATVGAYAITYNAQDDSNNAATQQTRNIAVADTTPPTITCPADIAVDPESPAGTVVTFNATATDICDAAPTVACPDSGNTFGVGTTTVVTCTATDASNNQTPCSLTVKVFSPQEVVNNLQTFAADLGKSGTINKGQENSLHSNLNNILRKIADLQTNAACGQLRGFVSKLNDWITDGTLTAAEAQPLLTSVNNLQATLACP